MKLLAIKTAGDIRAAVLAPTPGRPSVEVTTEGTTLKGVRIGQCHFTSEAYGSAFKVLREVEFTEEQRYRVKAEVPNFPASVDYIEDFTAARAKQDSYGSSDGLVVTMEQVRVLVDDDRKVVREVGADEPEGGALPPPPEGDDLPF
jgi:hypothetical protein